MDSNATPVINPAAQTDGTRGAGDLTAATSVTGGTPGFFSQISNNPFFSAVRQIIRILSVDKEFNIELRG